MGQRKLQAGMLVENPRVPDWGPGKVIHIGRGTVHVFFRGTEGNEAKKLKPDSLVVAESQTDPVLDNLPPFIEKDGTFRLAGHRFTIQQARDKFLRRYPGGFYDPEYLGDRKTGERNYKIRAHGIWVDTLGDGQAEHLLGRGDIAEVRKRALHVGSAVNVLAVQEAAAFREGLEHDGAAEKFFRALLNLLASDPVRETFEPYVEAAASLPARGATHTDKWPVATVFPFLARPDTYMFVKPTITKTAAERLAFDIRYDPRPNWVTYERVLRMSWTYMQELTDLGPRDLIDIQSFFWVTGDQFEQVEAAQKAKAR